MKYFIITGLIVLSFISQIGAQQMVNGDFAINRGNCNNCDPGCYNVTVPLGGTPMIYEPELPNWYVSHGSPNFPTAWNATYPNSIGMACEKSENEDGTGEGIVGGYLFKAYQVYKINVGILGYSDPSVVNIKIVKGTRPKTYNCLKSDCVNGYQGEIPSVNPSDVVTFSLSSLTYGDNILYFVAPYDYHWIWLYAHTTDLCDAGFDVSHVFISPVCNQDDLYLSPMTVSSGTYTNHRRIYVGSTYEPASYHTTVSPGTVFEAKYSVELRDKLVMTPSLGNPIISTINPNSCGEVGVARPANDQPAEINQERMYSSEYGGQKVVMGQKSLLGQKHISIYPNPVEDRVTIVNDNYLNTTITILSVDGKIQKRWNTSKPNETVSLSDLNSGVYFIKVNGPNTNFVEKVIIK